MDTRDLLKLVIDTAEEFKAEEITILKVSDVCDFADYFVIMSGASTTQIRSLTEELGLRCKHAGRQARDIEGLTASEWCLLDFGDIVVHVFHPQKRAYYNLEALWDTAETIVPGTGAGPQ